MNVFASHVHVLFVPFKYGLPVYEDACDMFLFNHFNNSLSDDIVLHSGKSALFNIIGTAVP